MELGKKMIYLRIFSCNQLYFQMSQFSLCQMNLVFLFLLKTVFHLCLLTLKSVSWEGIMGQLLLFGSHHLHWVPFVVPTKLLWPLTIEASVVTWLAQGQLWCCCLFGVRRLPSHQVKKSSEMEGSKHLS